MSELHSAAAGHFPNPDGSSPRSSSEIHEQWLHRAESALEGILSAEKLAAQNCESFELRAIYRAEDVQALPYLNSLPGFPPYVRRAKASGYLKKA